MEEHGLYTPSLTIALAMLGGVVAQVFGHHLRLPGIIVLLTFGVLFGPDGLDAIRPDVLGEGLTTLVGFAAAIILFEGGLALQVRRLRRARKPVRQLVTVGALVTLIGGMLVAQLFLSMGWRMAFLFGTLVIVTGPTVIGPLLRRFNVQHETATILEAEGVLIDAVGAITAAVALDVALQPSTFGAAAGVVDVLGRLGFGAFLGFGGGWLLSELLRLRRLVPEELENILVLAFVLALFQGSNAVLHESGIAAVTVAGIVVGSRPSSGHERLHAFKADLTNLFIGTLFVLLAADVRVDDVLALGRPALYTVIALIVVVRPLNVLAGTYRCGLSWQQQLFIAWIGPRGIIAAAVASLFAVKLEAQGLDGGTELRALVFAVIAATVLFSGLTGGLVARVLGLRRPSNAGFVVYGSNALAVELASALDEREQEIVLMVSDPHEAQHAEQAGLRILFGNPLTERALRRAELDTRTGIVAATTLEEANLLFVERAQALVKLGKASLALSSADENVTEKMVERAHAAILFGYPIHITQWASRVENGDVVRERWRVTPAALEDAPPLMASVSKSGSVLPLIYTRGGSAEPCVSGTVFSNRDELDLLVLRSVQESEGRRLESLGLERAPP